MLLEEDVLGLFDRLSNRGRWGTDDELGTLNFITPEKRISASHLVKRGLVVSLGHDLSTVPTSKNSTPILHRMLFLQHDGATACVDEISIAPHGVAITHADAIGHLFFEGGLYNGRRAADNLSPSGLAFGSVFAMREGIVTRGVLLDIAKARGDRWLEPTELVEREDLEAAERAGGVNVARGDVVVVRVGLEAREAVQGPEDPTRRAGLAADCLPWLYEREVAAFGGDCTEVIPSGYPRVPYPLHQVGFVSMGLVLIDNLAVERLAATTEEAATREFLFLCAPLRIPRGTGSPVNPLAVF
jgi:kynurenine formamidase